ncbi:unnamed protein product [Dracunculus medinensis]|uniref:ShKT domain-containing protein n=1 Tax=Dracunculus medinensis TaxID=318479 RepID=A0A0N4UGE5_DRAME|nr:unnamed protein product [Dracunculus medinensis]
MLALLLILAFLHNVDSIGVQLNRCLASSLPAVPRPWPHPSACKDKYPVICNSLFSPLPSDLTHNSIMTNPYLVNPNCQNSTLLAAAEMLCPSSCALCCLTPDYKCKNSAPSCSAFSHKPEMCTDPQTAAEALNGCPATCGLCTKPGANGVCSDTPGAPCEELKPALSCYNKYMRQNCMRTCKFDDCKHWFHSNAAEMLI